MMHSVTVYDEHQNILSQLEFTDEEAAYRAYETKLILAEKRPKGSKSTVCRYSDGWLANLRTVIVKGNNG